MSARGINHSLGFTGEPGIRVKRPPAAYRPPLAEGRVLMTQAAMHVVSEANVREHHMAKGRRVKAQRGAAALLCLSSFGSPPGPPLLVRLTRIAPRELDSDNLASAFKAVRDGIADWLGVKDNHKQIRWEYAQEKGAPKSYSIRIELSLLKAGPC